MIIGVIAWVLFFTWLVSSLYPSREMRRDAIGNYVYYGLWTLVFGSGLYLQYRIMAPSGHVIPAVVSDVIGVCLGAIRLWTMHNHRPRDPAHDN